jgi:hypothetical protein
MTNTGLKEFQEEKEALIKDAESILLLCYRESGHLGDVISSIRTTISSMDLKANKLSNKFLEQKSK